MPVASSSTDPIGSSTERIIEKLYQDWFQSQSVYLSQFLTSCPIPENRRLIPSSIQSSPFIFNLITRAAIPLEPDGLAGREYTINYNKALSFAGSLNNVAQKTGLTKDGEGKESQVGFLNSE